MIKPVSYQSLTARLLAVVEVLLVFVVTFLLIWLAALVPTGQLANRFLSYIVMIGFPLLILLVTRRSLPEYGLTLRGLKAQLNITLAAMLPVFVAAALYGGIVPQFIPRAIVRWEGAFIISLCLIAIFFWLAWSLRKQPTLHQALPLLGIAPVLLHPFLSGMLLPSLLQPPSPGLVERLAGFFFYLLFLGPGEEFLFRGYIQSRLNAAFGRPFCFWGVPFGWGLVIASLMFGLMHAFSTFSPFIGRTELTPWWAVWTVFGGFTSGYIREKAGSILPPALLHGLPQAIASLALGIFSVR